MVLASRKCDYMVNRSGGHVKGFEKVVFLKKNLSKGLKREQKEQYSITRISPFWRWKKWSANLGKSVKS